MNESEATERTDGDQQQVLGANPVSERERGVTARPFPSSRRLVTAAVRSGRRIMPMHGLFDVDVTTARSMLAETDPPLSLTALWSRRLAEQLRCIRRCTPTATGAACWSNTDTSTCRP